MNTDFRLPYAVLVFSFLMPYTACAGATGPASPPEKIAALLSARLNTSFPLAGSLQTSGPSQARIVSVVSAASFTHDLAPGALVSFFTADAPLPFTVGALSIPLPTGLDEAAILINGTPIPLLYASPSSASVNGQINAQLPYEIPAGQTSATLVFNGVPGTPYTFSVASAAPEIFVFSSTRAIVQNSDASLNIATNAAAAGSFVVVYLTGGGALDNHVPTGDKTPLSPLSRITGSASAAIGGKNAPVLFLGLTPNFVGLYQANLEVPAGLAAGDHPISITINGHTSNAPLITTK